MVSYCSQSVSGVSENDLGQHHFLRLLFGFLTEAKQITASMNQQWRQRVYVGLMQRSGDKNESRAISGQAGGSEGVGGDKCILSIQVREKTMLGQHTVD